MTPTGRRMKTKRKVLHRSGSVTLVEMEKDGVIVYGVTFPAKLGGGTDTEQFLKRNEAERSYARYEQFFHQELNYGRRSDTGRRES